MADREFKIKITSEADLSASRATADSYKDIEKSGTKAHEEISKSAEHSEVSHRALRVALSQLGPEFAHIGHAAVTGFANPSTAALILVAAAAGSLLKHFEKLKEEAAASAKALKDLDSGGIGGLTEAWGNYNIAVQDSIEKLGGVQHQAEKALRAIDAAAKREKDLLDSSKALELSQIRADVASGKISAAEGIDRRAGLELAGAGAGRSSAIEVEAKKQQIREQEISDLLMDAAKKKAEAAKITLMSAQQEEKIVAALKLQVEQTGTGGFWRSIWQNLRAFSGESSAKDILSQRDLEAAQRSSAESALGRFEDPVTKKNREDLRERRKALFGEAGKEETTAAGLIKDQPGAAADIAADQHNNALITLMEKKKILLDAQTEALKVVTELDTKATEMHKSTHHVSADIGRKMMEVSAELDRIRRSLKELDARPRPT